MKRDNSSGKKSSQNRKVLVIGLSIAAVLFLLAAVGFAIWQPKTSQPEQASLSSIAAAIAAGNVVKIEDTVSTGELSVYYEDGSQERALRDPSLSLLEQLTLLGLTSEQLSKVQIEILKTTVTAAANPVGILFILGLVGVAVAVATRTDKNDRLGKKNFEEANASRVKFTDIAGLDDNLQELQDIVTFLKEGNRYAQLGAKMPHGILMVGDPGTGKTLIAKAVAGEAGVPFFATSGSEFTEVFVGVGASRIRSLFRKARKKAPCIVFIDEIDAVGRSRHRSESGAEMEQDQTLNQLLVEMDGFGSAEGVIVLAATNRDDVLDSALTRAGRFDRRVYINRPDVKGREQILAIHTQGKKLGTDVDLATVAKATPGLVGADLANIVNEAAITAVRNGDSEICRRHFDEAIEKHIAGGVQRKSQVLSPDEREIIAYHEAGHAVVMHATRLSDQVHKISIIPRGRAGGYTMALPEQDSILISRCKILARITGLLGGRAAEEIFFQDITSGASNDLNVATHLAEEMVMRLGMDPRTGLRVFPQLHGSAAWFTSSGSQKTFETIDAAVKSILDECYLAAKKIITEKRDRVELIANRLLEIETLDRDQFVELMGSESA